MLNTKQGAPRRVTSIPCPTPGQLVHMDCGEPSDTGGPGGVKGKKNKKKQTDQSSAKTGDDKDRANEKQASIPVQSLLPKKRRVAAMAKYTSAQLNAQLMGNRRLLLDSGFQYERSYWKGKLDHTDGRYFKLYAMNIGRPGDTNMHPPKKKSVRVFVGGSRHPTILRVFEHNDISAPYRNPKTRDGATRWVLCIVLFYPLRLREVMSSQLMKLYWRKAHGLPGKLTRAFEIIRKFNLRYYIPPEHAAFVRRFEVASRRMYPNTDHLFRDPDINYDDDSEEADDEDDDDADQFRPAPQTDPEPAGGSIPFGAIDPALVAANCGTVGTAAADDDDDDNDQDPMDCEDDDEDGDDKDSDDDESEFSIT